MISVIETVFKLVEGGSIPIEVILGDPTQEEIIWLIDNNFEFNPSTNDSPSHFPGLWTRGLPHDL